MGYFPNKKFCLYLLTVADWQVLADLVPLPNWPLPLLFLSPCFEPGHVLIPSVLFHLASSSFSYFYLASESVIFHPDSWVFFLILLSFFKSLNMQLSLLTSPDCVHAHLIWFMLCLLAQVFLPNQSYVFTIFCPLCVCVASESPVCVLNLCLSL